MKTIRVRIQKRRTEVGHKQLIMLQAVSAKNTREVYLLKNDVIAIATPAPASHTYTTRILTYYTYIVLYSKRTIAIFSNLRKFYVHLSNAGYSLAKL